MAKTNTNGQNSVATSATNNLVFDKATINANRRILEGYTIPTLLACEEDYVFDELPNNNYVVGKSLETKWAYADIKFYVTKKGEQSGEDSYFMKEFYFETYLSDYATTLSDLLTNGNRIYKQIVKDISDYIVKNHPEFLIPEKKEEVA